MTTECRTERHVIKPSDPGYSLIRDFCKASKNLYNQANYMVRQAFIKDGIWLRYEKLDKLTKQNTEYPDYRKMPTAQSAQQTLRMLDSGWKSFFQAVKDWKKHPEKYFNQPKLPKYLKKDGCYVLTLTSQNCRIKDGILCFPKTFEGFTIRPVFLSNDRFTSFQQVRFLPENGGITAELVYKIRLPEEKADNGRYIGIDIGVNNLAAVANSWGARPFIMNGRPLKSMNQYANKKRAHDQSVLKKTENRYVSKRLDRLMTKRSRKINDYLHKASKYIIQYCTRNDVSRIVIGKNKNWKQGSDLGKKNNQNFVQIPFDRFIEMLEYKAKEHGITVILTEERYTSGTSFLDDEQPVKADYDKKRRVYRGLFISDKGIPINADINGAFQIMKKVIPIKWDRGWVLHPFIVTAV